jgi:carboxyl-terminal processing protease
MKNQHNARPDGWCTLFKMLCVLLMSTATIGCSIAQSRFLRDKTAQPDIVFYQAVKIIEDKYVDASGKTVKLDTSGCPDINTLLMQLDFTAAFFTPEELAIYNNPMKAAIGIEFEMKDGAWYVRRSMKDLPAHHAGIQSGDRILEIDGGSIDGVSLNTLYFKLQGNPGSEVELKILDKDNRTKVVRIRRQIIDLGPVITDRMVGKKLGYIRINRFDYGTSAQIKSAVKDLLKLNMQGLLLDLRRNSGGLMDEIVKTAELFLKRNTIIAHLSGSDPELDLRTGNWTPYIDIPLTVLIDRGTNSGAEILAAALRDNKRSILIGNKTAGTGAIYAAFPLKDGSLLHLRTHYVYSPAGKAIEGHGVEPDIESVVSDAERNALYEKLNSYSDKTGNTILVDTQLDKAISYISGEMMKIKPAIK